MPDVANPAASIAADFEGRLDMVIAILQDAAKTESLLNNLAEAEFDLEHISVLMRDPNQRNIIADDVGPLKGTKLSNVGEGLTRLGLGQQEITTYLKALNQGQVLVVIDTSLEAEPTAHEMLHDHAAQLVKGVR
jgi:hypothetical protein